MLFDVEYFGCITFDMFQFVPCCLRCILWFLPLITLSKPLWRSLLFSPSFLVVLLFSGAGSLQEVQCKRHVFQIHSLLDKFVMLMLSHNINFMLCRSFPSVWQVFPIRVKLPCVCFLLWKVYLRLNWFSFVVARVSFQHLVLHGLLTMFNLKRIIPFFRKQYARKNTNWQIFSYLLVVLHLCPLLLFFTVPVAVSFQKMLRLGLS